MTKFEELHAAHERLMEQSKSPKDPAAFVEDVQHEIHNMCVAAEDIPAPRERDQLRAILRFWASYVYDQTGTYPDTTLHPAKATPAGPSDPNGVHPSLFRIVIAAGAALIVLLIVVAIVRPPTGQPFTGVTADASVNVISPRPATGQLTPQYNVLTSGPSPFDENVWVVKLQLDASGGDGNYIFWMNGVRLPDDSNNQYTVEGTDCNPEKPIMGVTSGGQATSLELVVQPPLSKCR
jgi:hypothetical protein